MLQMVYLGFRASVRLLTYISDHVFVLHQKVMRLYKRWHRPIQYQNGPSNLLTPYQEQPRSTRNVVAYPRPAFSATNRTNCAPTSFDQQIQVPQGHTLYRNKEIEIPRSMVVKALGWWSRRASQHPAVQSPGHP